MIERYSRDEMSAIWSDENRLRLMLAVEIAVLEAGAKEKKIPESEIRSVRALSPRTVLSAARKEESRSSHEIMGMVQAVSSLLGSKAPAVLRYLHYGLTSSDVLDTALAMQLRDSAGLLLDGWAQAAARIKALARKHEFSWMAGRTHGVHAEPITLGVKLAGWHAEALRNIERLDRAQELIAYGKISGAVGAFTQTDPGLEAKVCAKLGLKAEPVATQVIPRDRHADFFHALVLSAAAIERFALEIRHLQRTEVLELEEPFGAGQKGSSAMPHKKNPVLCENLCGLSRLIRSYAGAAVEDIALWHERDISHSSVERVILPDACILLDFMLHRFSSVLEGLKVYPERMRENLEKSLGLVYSQRVLLRLVDSGAERLQAYDAVQDCAMKAWRSRRPFLDILREHPEVAKRLSKKELEACFDSDGYRGSVRELLKRGGVL